MLPNLTHSLSSTSTNKSADYVPALTGVRAMAAYLVFLHHHNPAPSGTFLHRLFEQGYIGVSLFFVLSGFLIHHCYADDYVEGKTWSWRRYWQSRLARIFPLYIPLLFLTIIVNILAGRIMSWSLIGLNITLLKGFFDAYKFTGIAQSWSLTVEICFYLSAPLLFIALRHWGVFFLTISLASLGLVFWILPQQLASQPISTLALFRGLSFVAFYTFFGRGFEFIVGMWLARRWHLNQLPQVRYATFIGLSVIAGCIVWQAYFTVLTTHPIRLFWSEVVVYNYMLPVGIGLFFLGLLTQPSVIRQLLSHPITQFLGRSSYEFYLIHTGVIANGLHRIGVTNGWWLFSLLVGISLGIHFFFPHILRIISSKLAI